MTDMVSAGQLVGIAVWLLFPLRMLLDTGMSWPQRRRWALACAVAPLVAYIVFLIVRAVRASSPAHAA
ncbi:hypothetical protein [Pseudoxanthomonas dokdonensis]|uniref:Uncharacterized protein n=1 Tax=Pseudoxanthomonas dokdonensis TaxID=344882 RepID=A0A0R0CGA0_9GAMM|nr:hypothetical protein [Pseudoxanthomonas dokdonensis]KRG68825.1 hypothetical protein ABB29_10060 [Pseudoxanthomonas dokdonensis]